LTEGQKYFACGLKERDRERVIFTQEIKKYLK
jgi:hypothetical protein